MSCESHGHPKKHQVMSCESHGHPKKAPPAQTTAEAHTNMSRFCWNMGSITNLVRGSSSVEVHTIVAI